MEQTKIYPDTQGEFITRLTDEDAAIFGNDFKGYSMRSEDDPKRLHSHEMMLRPDWPVYPMVDGKDAANDWTFDIDVPARKITWKRKNDVNGKATRGEAS